MNRPIVITAATRVSHQDENADTVGRQLAEELVRIFERADYPEIENLEVRLDHYLVGKDPHLIPYPEVRVTVRFELDLDV